MTTLIYLIPVALFLGGLSLIAFLWALRSGQYEDLDGAAQRILIEGDKDQVVGGSGALAERGAPARAGLVSSSLWTQL